MTARPLLASLCLAIALPAAAGTLEDIQSRGTIRLGYSETKAPFSFKAPNDGQPAGFSVELCRRVAEAVAKRLAPRSLRLEWVALDPETRLAAVSGGKVDIECGTTTQTIARRQQVDFSLPIYADAATVMARTAVAVNMREMNGRRVAVADNTTTLKALEKVSMATPIKPVIVKTKTLAEAFALLKDQKVDAIAGDRTALVGSYLMGGGGDGFTVFAENLSYEPYSLVIRRGDADFRLLVDATLAAIYRSTDIEKIYQAWLLPLGKPSEGLAAVYAVNALPE